jgi:hypothetical protein
MPLKRSKGQLFMHAWAPCLLIAHDACGLIAWVRRRARRVPGLESPSQTGVQHCDTDAKGMKGTGLLCITLRTATWVALIILPRSSPTAGME